MGLNENEIYWGDIRELPEGGVDRILTFVKRRGKERRVGWEASLTAAQS